MVGGRGDVIGDKEIEIAILVEIGKRAPSTPERRTHARCGGDIGERAVAAIVVQHVRPEARDVQIDPAIVVVVAGAGTHSVPALADTGATGHVLERSIAAVVKQAMLRLPGDRWIGDRSTIDEKEIDPAIVVVVEKQTSRPHRFDQEFLCRCAVDVLKRDAGIACHLGELDGRSLRRVALLAMNEGAADDRGGEDG
jgi:hypothetical protein